MFNGMFLYKHYEWRRNLIYQIAKPVAEGYCLPAVYLFGSYARGTADDESDVDLLVDTTGTALKSLVTLGALYNDLEEALDKKIDLVTVSSLTEQL